MVGFTNSEEARAHKQARDAWLKAEREALARLQGRSERICQLREELTCGCGQKAMLTVSFDISDTPYPSQNGLCIGGADAADRADGALDREAKDSRSGLQAQNAVFDVVHYRLHVQVGPGDARAQPESEKAEFGPPPAYASLLKGAGCQPILPQTTPITFLPGSLPDISPDPRDRLCEIVDLMTEAISTSARIGLIREAAALANELEETAAAYAGVWSSFREGDKGAIAEAAEELASDFLDAHDAAISALVKLITDPQAAAQMDEIEACCADQKGGA